MADAVHARRDTPAPDPPRAAVPSAWAPLRHTWFRALWITQFVANTLRRPHPLRRTRRESRRCPTAIQRAPPDTIGRPRSPRLGQLPAHPLVLGPHRGRLLEHQRHVVLLVGRHARVGLPLPARARGSRPDGARPPRRCRRVAAPSAPPQAWLAHRSCLARAAVPRPSPVGQRAPRGYRWR